MTEPECDFTDVVRCLQGQHGTGVPQHMRGDSLASQGRAETSSSAHVSAQDVREPAAGELLAARIEKHLRHCGRASDRQPSAHGCSGFLPEWKRPLSTSLTVHADSQLGVEAEVCQAQTDQFRNSQATGTSDMQHGAVTDPVARAWIGTVENGLDLGAGQKGDQPRIGAFDGDGEGASHLIECGRNPVLDKPHEGFDGRQPRVAGARAVASMAFEVFEEGKNQRRIDLFEGERGGGNGVPPADELEEKPERVGVRVTRVHTGLALDG